MKMSVLKAPFGPEYTLYEGEFLGIARHRIMLFFYFGLVCMILVSSIGRQRDIAKPELVIGLAAILVTAGIGVVMLCRALAVWWASHKGTAPYVDLGLVLVVTVTTSVALGELLEPPLFGTPRSGPMQLALKFVFYLTLTELFTTILMQNTLTHILNDLRKGKTYAPDGTLLSATPDRLA